MLALSYAHSVMSVESLSVLSSYGCVLWLLICDFLNMGDTALSQSCFGTHYSILFELVDPTVEIHVYS